ncbi:MAG TPA: SMP-30/gluconolactonase/LRE family protein [Sphingomonadaceae bacterium]
MKFRSRTMIAALALTFAVPASAQLLDGEQQATIAPIAGVVARGAKWDRVWSSYMTADGMTAAPDGTLLFAQEQSDSVIRLQPDGKWWVAVPYVEGAGAVSVDAAGRMFAVERTCTDPGLHRKQCAEPTRVTELVPEHKVLASAFADGKPLGRLNDLQADGHGGAFFTQTGLYHVAADGTVSVVVDKVDSFTNGLQLSPDGKTLYVTDKDKILAFDVAADGSTSNRRVFVILSHEGKGFGADGLAADSAGRLYAAADAGVYVIDPSGKELGIIPTPRRAITLAFAGPDKHTLYIGAMGAVGPDGKDWQTPKDVRNVAMTIYRVKMLAAGPANKPK